MQRAEIGGCVNRGGGGGNAVRGGLKRWGKGSHSKNYLSQDEFMSPTIYSTHLCMLSN